MNKSVFTFLFLIATFYLFENVFSMEDGAKYSPVEMHMHGSNSIDILTNSLKNLTKEIKLKEVEKKKRLLTQHAVDACNLPMETIPMGSENNVFVDACNLPMDLLSTSFDSNLPFNLGSASAKKDIKNFTKNTGGYIQYIPPKNAILTLGLAQQKLIND